MPETTIPDDPTLLSARDVHKTYRTGDVEVAALRGIDLDILRGSFNVVMGPSGNGKTTLLNCLSGLDEIDRGHVTLAGHDVHGRNDRSRTRLRAERMGFVFQSFNLLPVLDVAENAELPLLAAGVGPKKARVRALELLDRVGLADRARHRPAELSGGEQQRVAIARALVTGPDVVWADEPTGNLDSATARQVLDLFREVNAAGQTIVMITHDPSVAGVGDRRLVVTDGRLSADEIVGARP